MAIDEVLVSDQQYEKEQGWENGPDHDPSVWLHDEEER